MFGTKVTIKGYVRYSLLLFAYTLFSHIMFIFIFFNTEVVICKSISVISVDFMFLHKKSSPKKHFSKLRYKISAGGIYMERLKDTFGF